MKNIAVLLLIFMSYSCVPVKVAPNIKTHKVVQGKKFKKGLLRDYAFIFNDPKDANEFYNYINIVYQLNDNDVGINVPIQINNESYYLTYEEIERTTETVNLIPIAVDAKRENNGNSTLLKEFHTSRKGDWYLAITIIDDDGYDCLNPKYKNRGSIIKHLEILRQEYLKTSNYYDALLKKKP